VRPGRSRARAVIAFAALLASASIASARAGAATVPLPIPLDAPTQRACAPPDPSRGSFEISLRPFELVSLGDYPPENDAVSFSPNTPYFHALWVDGLVRYFTAHDLRPVPGELARGCVHPAERLAGGVYRSKGVPPGTYIMVMVVRRAEGVAALDGGFVAVQPHAPDAAGPSARFFEEELDVEEHAPIKPFGHIRLVDEIR